jgi:PKD repeat protein
MRKLLGSALVLILLVPALSAAAPGDEPRHVRALDALLADFDPPSWLEGSTPLPPIVSGRDVVIPSAREQEAIRKVMSSVSKEYLLSFETTLQGFGSRYVRAPGMYNASRWLHDVLLGNGRLRSEYQDWSYVNSSGVTHTVQNVVLTLPGLNTSSDRVYYIFNHDDSMLSTPPPTVDQLLNNCPGADDDGSGVAATLEAARVLSRYGFQDTIKFGFFNGEELGLLGSYYWAERMAARKENVQGSIDYDMIGYSTGNAQYDLNLVSNPASQWQLQYMLELNDRYKIGLRILPQVTSDWLPTDITSFYRFGFPGVFGIEEEFSPVYHTMQDRVEVLNMTLVERCTRMAVAATAEMARMLYVDVGVENLTASPLEPLENENVRVTATLANVGNLNASDVEVQFLADGYPFSSRRLWVPANGTNTTSADWTAVLGRHKLTVVADPNYEQADANRQNNTANLTILANDRPRAALTAMPLTVLTNETVVFNGSNSYDSAGVSAYNFSFGDGTGTGWTDNPGTTHAYAQDGVFVATLVVRDGQGVVSNPSSLAVSVQNRPPSGAPYSNVTRALTFEPVQFFANCKDADGSVASYAWDFGDGASGAEEDPVHGYNASGTYDVQLVATDNDGGIASLLLRVLIDDRPPQCSIDAPNTTGTIEDQFEFTANATDADGYISGWLWDFGDGATSKARTAKHAFKKPGNYTVRLTVQDDDGSSSRALVNITVADTPPRAVASLGAAQAETFKRIHFIGEQSRDLEGPVSFQWDFGDGNGSIEASPWHAYTTPGEYNATLTVRDIAGQTDSVTLPAVSIRNRQPTASFRVFGCFTLNGTVYFDGTGSSDPEGPVTLSWDFGDNGTAKGSVAEHVFPSAGSYTVKLTVTDQNEGTATFAQVVTVNPPPPPPVVKKPAVPEDKTGTVNLLLVVVIVLVAALAAAAFWGARRGGRPAAAPVPVAEARPVPPEAPPAGPYDQSMYRSDYKEWSPAEEQLKQKPRH